MTEQERKADRYIRDNRFRRRARARNVLAVLVTMTIMGLAVVLGYLLHICFFG